MPSGRPMGWVFGAIAGGMALGAAAGPWLESLLGWRWLFGAVAVASGLAAALAWPRLVSGLARPTASRGGGIAGIALDYARLLRTRRGATVYALIFLNGVFHSGVFSWLGVYFVDRYRLNPRDLGLALLGYGIPGFLLGPLLGRLADRYGRRWLIRGGLFLAASCALLLSKRMPALAATGLVTLLSLGFDLTHPLLAGIVSSLDREKTAQAMAINTFAVFVGFGLGSIAFGALYVHYGLFGALITFGVVQFTIAAMTFPLFDSTWR